VELRKVVQLVLMLICQYIICDMSKGVFDEVEEGLMVNVSVNQEKVVVIKNLLLNPVGNEGFHLSIVYQPIFLPVRSIKNIRLRWRCLIILRFGGWGSTISSRICSINAFQSNNN
jgi:hypothetical protein